MRDRLEDTGEVFFFDYGVIICWNMLQEHEQEMIEEVSACTGQIGPRSQAQDSLIDFFFAM